MISLMILGADACDGSAGTRNRTGDIVQFLHLDKLDIGIIFLKFKGRHDAGDSRAYDDHVGLHGLALNKFSFLRSGLKRLHIDAGGGESALDGSQDGVAGDGSAGNCVYCQTLSVDDAAGHV